MSSKLKEFISQRLEQGESILTFADELKDQGIDWRELMYHDFEEKARLQEFIEHRLDSGESIKQIQAHLSSEKGLDEAAQEELLESVSEKLSTKSSLGYFLLTFILCMLSILLAPSSSFKVVSVTATLIISLLVLNQKLRRKDQFQSKD